MKTSRAIVLLALLFLAAASRSAMACAACWGDTSGSKTTTAAAVGIGAMVLIMFAMFGAIGAVVRHLAWRAKNPLPDYDELLSDDSATPDDPTPKA